jgi:hypothetical protein
MRSAFAKQATPILDMDEFWTPAWEIQAIEARLLAPNGEQTGARLFQTLEAFDD